MVLLFLLILFISVYCETLCIQDSNCTQDECCFLARNQPEADSYCVPSLFCNKQVGGGFCLDDKECYSDCCVDMQCKTAEFCFDRYVTPIIDGATVCVCLLFVCIFSCCYACRLSSQQKRLQQEIYLIKYRLAQLLPLRESSTNELQPIDANELNNPLETIQQRNIVEGEIAN